MKQDTPITPTDNTPAQWLRALPIPHVQSHKYSRGHAVVQGGDAEHSGAARLAARAALRVGAGAVTVACDAASLPVYAAALEAVMTRVTPDEAALKTVLEDGRVSAFLIGPAAGVSEATRQRVLLALQLKKPVVLDADALTVFSPRPQELFDAIGTTPAVLTPHAGEFARLFPALADAEPASAARAAAAASGAVVLLKGAETLIAAPDGRIARNRESSPYLATAGSGDVLAGIITGLLAGGMSPYEAACAGAWIHGRIGREIGAGLIAEDMPDHLPPVLAALHAEANT